MEMKPKPIYEILLKLLKKEFMKEFADWGIVDDETLQKYFDGWLLENGYFEKIKTEQKMKTRTYILMKDLPDYKAGELFSTEDGLLYVSHSVDEDGTVGKWPARFVENNLAWFKPKEEEKMKVEVIGRGLSGDCLHVKIWPHKREEAIFKEKHPAIKKAIEDIINAEPTLTNVKEEKPVLFITEDGVGLSWGKMWLVSTTAWHITDVDVCVNPFRGVNGTQFKYFSTQDAAEAYVLNNAPYLSIKDVGEVLNGNKYYSRQYIINALTEKIKLK